MDPHTIRPTLAHAAVALAIAAALTPAPAWAGPVTLLSREVSVFVETQPSFGPPVTDERSLTGSGSTPLTVEAFLPRPSTVDNPFRPPPGFLSAQANPSGLGAGVNSVFVAGTSRLNPPNVLIARALETQTFRNDTASTTGVIGTFTIPSPTVTLLFGGVTLDPADPKKPRGTAFAEITTSLTDVNGVRTGTVLFTYGVDTFYDPLTAELLSIPVGSAPGAVQTTGPNGQVIFTVAEATNQLLALGVVGPGETLAVTGRYLTQVSSGFGETGASAFVGDPNNLSASSARFTLATDDGTPPVNPSPTPVPAPAGWPVLAAGLAVLGAVRRLRPRG